MPLIEIRTAEALRSISCDADAPPARTSPARAMTTAATERRPTGNKVAGNRLFLLPRRSEPKVKARSGPPIRCGAQRAALHDLRQLGNRVPELGFGVVEMRPEADAGARAEVADDVALPELSMNRGIVGRVHEDGAATPIRVARAADPKPAPSSRSISSCVSASERSRMRPDADLLDHVVARRRRVERRRRSACRSGSGARPRRTRARARTRTAARAPASRRTSARGAPRDPGGRRASRRPARRRAT